jgi:hypothetical protein
MARLNRIARPTGESLKNLTGILQQKRMERKGNLSVPEVWGEGAQQIVAGSGKKLKFDEDSEAILRFVGSKDISAALGKEPGEATYLVFHDGRTPVTVPLSYSLQQVQWEQSCWYYLHVTGMLENKNESFNSMKDFEVYRLGSSGSSVGCPQRISPSGKIVLSDETCMELNYSRINYPLR